MHVFTLQYSKTFISLLFYLLYILERAHGGLLPMAAGQSQHLLPSSFPDPGTGRAVPLFFFFFFPHFPLNLCFAILLHTSPQVSPPLWLRGRAVPLLLALPTATQCSLIDENGKEWSKIRVKAGFVTLD